MNTNKMKKTNSVLNLGLLLPCLVLFLTGCGARPQKAADGTAWQEDWVTIGNRIGVEDCEPLTLLESRDTLAADGLYYAAWTDGDCTPYQNSAGDTVDLYDAQLYLLASETTSEESAQTTCDKWLAASKSNYEIESEDTVDCSGQPYTLITYRCISEDNPYDHGVSAFTVHGDLAVCVELNCLKGYFGNLKAIMTDFLNGCHYSAD